MAARVTDAPAVELGLQAEAVTAHRGQHGGGGGGLAEIKDCVCGRSELLY